MDLVIKQKNKVIRNYSCKKFIDCGTPKGLLDGLKFILTKKEIDILLLLVISLNRVILELIVAFGTDTHYRSFCFD